MTATRQRWEQQQQEHVNQQQQQQQQHVKQQQQQQLKQKQLIASHWDSFAVGYTQAQQVDCEQDTISMCVWVCCVCDRVCCVCVLYVHLSVLKSS